MSSDDYILCLTFEVREKNQDNIIYTKGLFCQVTESFLPPKAAQHRDEPSSVEILPLTVFATAGWRNS